MLKDMSLTIMHVQPTISLYLLDEAKKSPQAYAELEKVNLKNSETAQGLLEKHKDADLKDVRVTSFQKYETTAVDYKMIFLLEFIFEDNISVDTKVAVIKELQGFFNQV